MNIDDLTIKQARELASMFQPVAPVSDQAYKGSFLGRYVIIRTYSAGVFAGVLVKLDSFGAVIREARRIWKWEGAFTLSEISRRGPANTSRLSEPVVEMLVTQPIEVIPTEQEAETCLRGLPSYRP